MPLTVLHVAYPLAPVAPDAVGGAEQVLGTLDRALVERGHRSIVVACEGSRVRGTLCATPPLASRLDDGERERAREAHRQAIAGALARWPVDVVHMHGLDFHEYLPTDGVPVLATLHLPPAWYPPAVFTLARPRTYLHCVSAAQARACPPGAALLPVIENGVALDEYARPARLTTDGPYVIALGRICPEKGFHLALDAARRAGADMVLAGAVFGYDAHRDYYAREIQPRLDARRRFIGPVGPERKRHLLASARCLLVPSLAPETSSLVAMEALACGTPVVAFPAGALAEIVDHGVTGFLVHDVRDMADAIVACAGLDREACREVACRRFSANRMAGEYVERYRVLARER